MGGSWFADEAGVFVVSVTDGHGTELARVELDGLAPTQELYCDVERGRDR